MSKSGQLVAALRRIQDGETGEPKRNGLQMAQELGVTAAHWSNVCAGRRAIGRDTARRVLRRWPELADDYWADLMDEQVQEYDREEREEVPA